MRLNDRETQVLTLLAQGHTHGAAAKIAGTSKSGIARTLHDLMGRLNTKNVTETVTLLVVRKDLPLTEAHYPRATNHESRKTQELIRAFGKAERDDNEGES